MIQGSKSWIGTHPYLYHYTTEAGFKGILESNALRATYFADLNDSREIYELRKPFEGALTSRLVLIVGELRRSSLQLNKKVSELGGNVGAAKQFAHAWVDSLYRSTFSAEAQAQTYCCVTSFCSHATDQQYEQENGLLSQWRGYGTDGGFCLVFDAGKLSAQLATERASYFYLHTDLRPVHYYIEGSPLTNEFSQLLQLSEDFMRSAIVGGRDFDTSKVFEPFVTTATTYKHRGFYEEREVRLIAMAATQATVDRIKHMKGFKDEPVKTQFRLSRNGSDRRYIELFGKNFSPLPLERVIVGPSLNQDKRFEFAKKLVPKGVAVAKSATPFIG